MPSISFNLYLGTYLCQQEANRYREKRTNCHLAVYKRCHTGNYKVMSAELDSPLRSSRRRKTTKTGQGFKEIVVYIYRENKKSDATILGVKNCIFAEKSTSDVVWGQQRMLLLKNNIYESQVGN
eukprot:gene15477-6727_t